MKVARTVWSGGKFGDNLKELPIAIAYGYSEDTIDYHDGDMLYFQTAWAAPHPVLEKLTEVFQDIELKHERGGRGHWV